MQQKIWAMYGLGVKKIYNWMCHALWKQCYLVTYSYNMDCQLLTILHPVFILLNVFLPELLGCILFCIDSMNTPPVKPVLEIHGFILHMILVSVRWHECGFGGRLDDQNAFFVFYVCPDCPLRKNKLNIF